MNNISAVSVYDNVSLNDQSFSKSVVYQTVNDLLSINDEIEVISHCPLCMNTFEYKFLLFEHLLNFHRNFLIQVRGRTLNFKECPFCKAKFYGKHLMTKHALLHHPIIVQELFIDSGSQCFFCGLELIKSQFGEVINHIKEMHFMDFEKAFQDKFTTSTLEMTFSELMNFTAGSEKKLLNSFDSSQIVQNQALDSKQCQNLTFDEVEKVQINCFDFTDIKNQLQIIKNSKETLSSCTQKKSILKNLINNPKQKSVRRVLRFDIPDEKNKENNLIQKSANDELQLFDSDKFFIQDFLNTTIENWCVLPNDCNLQSSVKKSIGKILVKDEIKKFRHKNSSSIKVGSGIRSLKEFKYQCGKCQKLFKENLELVCHIKNNHRKFDLMVLKPSYRCGICNAQFFKNYYLKKHLHLHYFY